MRRFYCIFIVGIFLLSGCATGGLDRYKVVDGKDILTSKLRWFGNALIEVSEEATKIDSRSDKKLFDNFVLGQNVPK